MDRRHVLESVRQGAQTSTQRSAGAVDVGAARDADGAGGGGVEDVRGFFVDLPVDGEEGVGEHDRLLGQALVVGGAVQSEMVGVDEVAEFGWEVEEREGFALWVFE